MPQKKILVECSYFFRNRGIGNYQRCLVENLVEYKNIEGGRNFEFFFLINGLKGKKNLHPKNDNIIHFPFRINQILWDNFVVPIYYFFLKADCVHYTAGVVGFVSPLLRIPHVVTVHDLSFLKIRNAVSRPTTTYQWVGLYYRRFSIPFTFSTSRKILAVSGFVRGELEYYGKVEMHRVIQSCNSLSSELIDVSTRRCAKSKTILLITGSSEQKNTSLALEVILNVLSHNLDWSCLVVGIYGDNELCPRLSFLGPLNIRELGDLYCQAKVLFMPSLYESFSIPIIEAALFHNVVCMSNSGGAIGVLPRVKHVFDPRSKNDMNASLERAISYSNGCIDQYEDAYLIEQNSYVRRNYSGRRQAETSVAAYD